MALAEAAAIAGILGTAAKIIDTIYGRWIEFKTGKKIPQTIEPEHSALISNDPDQGALVLAIKGNEQSKVTYPELDQRLTPAEKRHIKVREKAMNSLYEKWEAAYPAIAMEDNPIRKTELRQQLAVVTEELGKELADNLRFIEKCGLMLDDHYVEFRDIVDGAPTRFV